VHLVPFVNQFTRADDINNGFNELSKYFIFDGQLTIEECYIKIKESKMSAASGTEGELDYVAAYETNSFFYASDV
jgi:hypothetical protein